MTTPILLSYICFFAALTSSLPTQVTAALPVPDGYSITEYDPEKANYLQAVPKQPSKQEGYVHKYSMAELMQADPLSLVTRYVGVGYNLLRGNPHGDFHRGGIDPGILITKHIFEFSYDEGKQAYYRGAVNNVPDQVEFHQFTSCSSDNRLVAYSGKKSYQTLLSTSMKAEEKFEGYDFSLSSGMEAARSGTEEQKRVNIDNEAICAYGRVRYLLENNDPSGKVSTSFYNAVKAITAEGWSPSDYFGFLEQWGTSSLGISEGGSFEGFSSSFSIDIETMNEQIDTSSQRDERVTTFSAGTEAEPLPVHMVLKPITEALEPRFWTNLPNGDTYTSLRVAEKIEYIQRALLEYPDYLQLAQVTDPQILIPNAWPDGHYALQSTPDGCPSGWSEGWRFQDTEDNNSNNKWSRNLPPRLRGRLRKDNIKLYYCVKGDSAPNYDLEWPKGSYCIARKDGRCPSNFHGGSIKWDDEDSNNKNQKFGTLPDGTYNKDTRIEFCCRNDERPNVPIILPKDQPFILYRYGGTCQSVTGMTVNSYYLRFDCEDSSNNNKCTGAHPDRNRKCGDNIILYLCYYFDQSEQPE